MGRRRRTDGKAPSEEREDRRLPPKPESYYKAVKGTCRMCGLPVLREDGSVNARSWWHRPECLERYMVIFHPGYARKAVKARDRRVCAACGVRAERWHVDHLRPIHEADKLSGDTSAWELGNMQTLCVSCHAAKTAAEAAKRASARGAPLLACNELDLSDSQLLSLLED